MLIRNELFIDLIIVCDMLQCVSYGFQSLLSLSLPLVGCGNSCVCRIHANRRLISRNLYAITPCLRQMLSLWQTTYTKLSFINADELLRHAGAFDLVEFIVSNQNHQQCQQNRMSTHTHRRSILCAMCHEKLNTSFEIKLNHF